jgi:hypothetical protein
MAKLRKHEYRGKSKRDDFKRIKDPTNKRKMKKRLSEREDYEK